MGNAGFPCTPRVGFAQDGGGAVPWPRVVVYAARLGVGRGRWRRRSRALAASGLDAARLGAHFRAPRRPGRRLVHGGRFRDEGRTAMAASSLRQAALAPWPAGASLPRRLLAACRRPGAVFAMAAKQDAMPRARPRLVPCPSAAASSPSPRRGPPSTTPLSLPAVDDPPPRCRPSTAPWRCAAYKAAAYKAAAYKARRE